MQKVGFTYKMTEAKQRPYIKSDTQPRLWPDSDMYSLWESQHYFRSPGNSTLEKKDKCNNTRVYHFTVDKNGSRQNVFTS